MTNVEVKKVHALAGHRDCVYTLQPGPLPNKFFSGAGDGMVVLWDLKQPDTGELIAQLPNSIYALHYLKKENLLVAGHNYDGIHLLDWKEKKEIRSLKVTTAAIFDINSFEENIIIASGDGALSIVDLNTWSITNRMELSSKSARVIAINKDLGEMAVGYSDFMIRIFDLKDWKLKHEWKAHQNSVFTLAYAPDSKTLLSGSRDARIKVWDATSGYEQAGEVVAHLYAINHLTYSPDAKHFVTCSLDKSIKVWSVEDLRLLKVIDKARHAGHGTSVNKLLWTPYNNELVSASDDRTISVWNIIF